MSHSRPISDMLAKRPDAGYERLVSVDSVFLRGRERLTLILKDESVLLDSKGSEARADDIVVRGLIVASGDAVHII